jgi:protein-S-isoprenylcysteine O-methyltransferase Ste14
MKEQRKDKAAVWLPPPLVYLAGIIAGALLDAFVMEFPMGLSRMTRSLAGAAAGIFGVGLVLAAFGLFRRTGQDPKPWKPTPEIISTGIYRFTRNPMYVGMGLIQAAVGIGIGSGWIVLLAPAALAVVYFTAVRHEEAYLERKFGDKYTRYKSSVRRWI